MSKKVHIPNLFGVKANIFLREFSTNLGLMTSLLLFKEPPWRIPFLNICCYVSVLRFFASMEEFCSSFLNHVWCHSQTVLMYATGLSPGTGSAFRTFSRSAVCSLQRLKKCRWVPGYWSLLTYSCVWSMSNSHMSHEWVRRSHFVGCPVMLGCGQWVGWRGGQGSVLTDFRGPHRCPVLSRLHGQALVSSENRLEGKVEGRCYERRGSAVSQTSCDHGLPHQCLR